MNYLIIILLVLIGLLQYNLWSGKGSFQDVKRLEASIIKQQEENQQLKERNEALQAEVVDLKKGLAAIEERARNELGMIQQEETFFHIIETKE